MAVATLFLIQAVLGAAEGTTEISPNNPKAVRRKPPVPAKIERYAGRVIASYDTDQDGQLTAAEWRGMQGSPDQLDADGNGIMTREEYAAYILRFSNRRHIRLLLPESTESEEPPLLQPKSSPAQAAATASKPAAAAAPAPPPSGPSPDGLAAAGGDGTGTEPPVASRAAARRRDS